MHGAFEKNLIKSYHAIKLRLMNPTPAKFLEPSVAELHYKIQLEMFNDIPEIIFIQRQVAYIFNTDRVKMILDKKINTARMVLPRHIAIYLCRKLVVCSVKEIATAFGYDFTNVSKSNKKIEKLRKSSLEFDTVIHRLEEHVRERLSTPLGG